MKKIGLEDKLVELRALVVQADDTPGESMVALLDNLMDLVYFSPETEAQMYNQYICNYYWHCGANGGCPFDDVNSLYGDNCDQWCISHPEQAIERAKKWEAQQKVHREEVQ